MTFQDLVEFVEYYKHLPNLQSQQLFVEIRHPYQTVSIQSIEFGLKYGNDKIVIIPEEPLSYK